MFFVSLLMDHTRVFYYPALILGRGPKYVFKRIYDMCMRGVVGRKWGERERDRERQRERE